MKVLPLTLYYVLILLTFGTEQCGLIWLLRLVVGLDDEMPSSVENDHIITDSSDSTDSGIYYLKYTCI